MQHHAQYMSQQEVDARHDREMGSFFLTDRLARASVAEMMATELLCCIYRSGWTNGPSHST